MLFRSEPGKGCNSPHKIILLVWKPLCTIFFGIWSAGGNLLGDKNHFRTPFSSSARFLFQGLNDINLHISSTTIRSVQESFPLLWAGSQVLVKFLLFMFIFRPNNIRKRDSTLPYSTRRTENTAPISSRRCTNVTSIGENRKSIHHDWKLSSQVLFPSRFLQIIPPNLRYETVIPTALSLLHNWTTTNISECKRPPTERYAFGPHLSSTAFITRTKAMLQLCRMISAQIIFQIFWLACLSPTLFRNGFKGNCYHCG